MSTGTTFSFPFCHFRALICACLIYLPYLNCLIVSQSFGQEEALLIAAKDAKVRVDQVPMKSGVWEVTIWDGMQLVDGPTQMKLCRDSMPIYFFRAIFPAENFGRVLLDEVIASDNVWMLADGSYEVRGGVRTVRGGPIAYLHHVTLHGEDRYSDMLSVTSHINTHPMKRQYRESGRWIAPCDTGK